MLKNEQEIPQEEQEKRDVILELANSLKANLIGLASTVKVDYKLGVN